MGDLKKLKKQRRSQLQLLNQDELDVEFLDEPSPFVCITNGGVTMGISRDLLGHVLSPFNVMKIMTPSRKQYAFASFSSLSQSKRAVSTINGCSIQALCQDESFLNDHLSSGPPINIYLSFISAIPILFAAEGEKCQANISAPPGLILIPNFIGEAEEIALLKFFHFANDNSVPVNCSGTSNAKMELRHRKVMHFGYEFNYTTNNVDPTKPLPGGLPEVCTQIITRMMYSDLVANKPDQLTVNRYLPGQGDDIFNFLPFIAM